MARPWVCPHPSYPLRPRRAYSKWWLQPWLAGMALPDWTRLHWWCSTTRQWPKNVGASIAHLAASIARRARIHRPLQAPLQCNSLITLSKTRLPHHNNKVRENIQVILFEIDFLILYTNLDELFCQFIRWTNWVNSGRFMENCWTSCQVMVDMKKV